MHTICTRQAMHNAYSTPHPIQKLPHPILPHPIQKLPHPIHILPHPIQKLPTHWLAYDTHTRPRVPQHACRQARARVRVCACVRALVGANNLEEDPSERMVARSRARRQTTSCTKGSGRSARERMKSRRILCVSTLATSWAISSSSACSSPAPCACNALCAAQHTPCKCHPAAVIKRRAQGFRMMLSDDAGYGALSGCL